MSKYPLLVENTEGISDYEFGVFPQILNIFSVSQKITINADRIEEHLNLHVIHWSMFYETYQQGNNLHEPYLVSLSN